MCVAGQTRSQTSTAPLHGAISPTLPQEESTAEVAPRELHLRCWWDTPQMGQQTLPLLRRADAAALTSIPRLQQLQNDPSALLMYK